MTDRVNGLLVALENDIRVDDVEPLINAIKCLQGVVGVKVSVVDSSDMLARMRINSEWEAKLFELIKGNR